MAQRKMTQGNPPLSFGVFYPIGYVVLAFTSPDAAQQTHDALLTGGYDESDIVHDSGEFVASQIEKLRPQIGVLARIGTETQQMDKHYELAKKGHDFLIVYAPTEPEANRVMNVARRFQVKLAQKYHRFAIEDLKI